MSQPRIPIISSFDNKGVREAQSAFKRLGDGAKNTAKVIGLAAAAVSGLSLVIGKKAVDAASDLSESMNAVNVVFGDAADGIHRLAEESATAVGLSAKDYNEFAVQFAGFTKNLTDSEKDIVDVTDELTTRIADFASVMNLDLNEAATVFNSTLAGSSEVIRKYGIDVSAAAVENFILESGIASSKNEITEAMKVQGRYALVMEATDKMSGDFANTSDGLANQQRILKAEFENVQAELGQHLLPAMETLIGVLVDYGIPALNNFVEWLGPKLEPAAQAFADGVERAVEQTADLRDTVGEASDTFRDKFNKQIDQATEFIETYRTELSYVAGAVGGITTALILYNTATATARGVTVGLAAAQAALTFVMSLSPWGAIALAIAAVVGALFALRLNYQDVIDAAKGVWADIQYGLLVIESFVRDGIEWLMEKLQGLKPVLDAVVGFFQGMYEDLRAIFDVVVEAVKLAIAGIDDAFDVLAQAASDAVAWIQEIFGPLVGWFNDNVVSTFEAAIEYFIALFDRIVQMLEPTVKFVVWLFQQIADKVTEVFGTIVSIAGAALEMMVNAFTGFVGVVQPLFEIFWETLKTVVVVAFEAIENTIEIALAIIRGIFEAGTALIKGDFSGVWDALKGIVTDSLEAMGDFISTWFDTTIDFIKTIPALIDKAAAGMFDGIKNAFKEAINFVIRGWNALEFRVPGFSIGPIGYSGFTLGVPDIPLLADGGIVNKATLAVIGEAGPEAVVPLSKAGSNGFGGATYNITVQAGVGDPGQIGQSVVEAIAAYERRNGAGWRAA